jgi:tetratricopeptide (TPR) repeat protein
MPARHEPPTGVEAGPSRDAFPGREITRSAWEWRSSAPELSRLLARHVAAPSLAEPLGSVSEDTLRVAAAEFVAECRLGHGLPALPRGCALLEAVRAARATELEHALLLELAGCAASLGAPAAGLAALTGVLDQADPPPTRAVALLMLAKCVPQAPNAAAARDAISAAGELCDEGGDPESTSLGVPAAELRAAVSLAVARRARRAGDLDEALRATDLGLERLAAGATDSGAVRARLHLERVLGLLASGRRSEASEHGDRLLAEPVRATGAAPTSWLAIALARQLDLPAERFGHAESHFGEAARLARRHDLPGPAADAADGLAHIATRDGRSDEAIEALRTHQLMTHRRRAVRAGARSALVAQFGVESSEAFPVSSDHMSRWLTARPARRGASVSAAELSGPPVQNGDGARGGGAVEPGEPAQGHDVPRPHGLAQFPGLVVTPGAGGRRRAPEADTPTDAGQQEGPPADEPGGLPGAGSADGAGLGMGELLAEALLALRSGEDASRAAHRRWPTEVRPSGGEDTGEGAGDDTRPLRPRPSPPSQDGRE